MSYSILQQPEAGSLQYSNGNIVTVVQQTDYDPAFYKDYKFWAKLKVNGIESVTLKSFPEPGTDKGVFNFNGIASAFTKFDYTFNNPDVFAQCPDSSCELQLYLGEEYNYNGSWFSQQQTSGNTFVALNAAPWKDDATLTQYILGSSDKKFLSKSIELKTANYLADQFLFFYNPGGNVCKKLEIVTFTTPTVGDYSGLSGIYRYDNPYSDASGVQRVGVGWNAIVSIYGSGEYSTIYGPEDIFSADIKCWQVCITADEGEKSSEIATVYIDELCEDSNSFQLFWLNNLGGFDSFVFNGKNVTNISKSAETYRKGRGKLVGDVFVTNTYDREIVPYATSLQDTIELSALWLTDYEIKLLMGLFASPVVFYQVRNANNFFYSGYIEDKDYRLSYRKLRSTGQKRYDLTFRLKVDTTYATQLQ